MKRIIFRGIEIFITDSIIRKDKMKKGFHYYCIRQNANADPITIEECVILNRYGTVACKKDLFGLTHDLDVECLDNDRYISLSFEEQRQFIKGIED